MAVDKVAGFAVVGPGRVGTALTELLVSQGYRLIEVAGRSDSGNRAKGQRLAAAHQARFVSLDRLSGGYDWLFLTVPDDALPAVVSVIAGYLPAGSVRFAVHMSGVHPAAIMEGLRNQSGMKLLSMHPLASIAGTPADGRTLRDALFTLEGDQEAVADAAALVESWGGDWQEITAGQKTAYHLGAVFVSNYLWTVLHTGSEIWRQAGVTGVQARSALSRLAESTVINYREHDDSRQALTGPIARGDLETLQRHLMLLEGLQETDPSLIHLYKVLGRATADRYWRGHDNRQVYERIIQVFQEGDAGALDD